MAVLDFKEIPEAHVASGLQDTFELFARDFLQFIGYNIVTDPNRGADGGADLIVEEIRTGVGGETKIKWLVSCKHKAHSGKSVSPQDDSNIRDRIEVNGCQGFIGFYSTLASAGLAENLERMQSIESQIFDHEKIESNLLYSAKGLNIVERYFPESLNRWRINNPEPAKIFIDKPSLKCKICKKELFDKNDKGIVTLWSKLGANENQQNTFEYVYWTCRGRCDNILRRKVRLQNPNVIDGWEDISDVIIPTIFIKWVVTIVNQIKAGDIYSDEAFENLKEFILNVFPYISRHLTDKQKERVKSLSMIPHYLGGLGYEK